MSLYVGHTVSDRNGSELDQVAALGGADAITVHDRVGAGVPQVAVDLAGTLGGTVGDGAADTVTVNGTNGDDHISVVSSGSSIVVNGLAAQVTINSAEAANDTLVINGLAGNDIIDASGLHAGQVNLTLNGGDGNDTITGSAGNDLVIGGHGDGRAPTGAGGGPVARDPGPGSGTGGGGAGNANT